ncbi:MFS transporter [Pseudalkalibacillus hwajinpoensis]|uniref:MFS transporter n=1 Tax=Guptibacillus hwajinpoensis TaxID=208199 RepID=UPI00146B1E7F|nr:MFS transporter [Pseudalkalibacillus hwajinpoensis]
MKNLHINVKIRLLVLVLQRLGTTLIIPFMAIYFAQEYGVATAGLIILITIMGSIFASLYAGYYSDKYGRKKILVFASFTRSCAFLLMALFNMPNNQIIAMSIFSLLLINICLGLSIPPTQAMIIDVTSKENRKYVYTLSYWFNNTAMAIGTLLGAFLFKDYFFELLLFVTFLNFVIFFLIKFLLVETHSLKQVIPIKKSPFHEFVNSYKTGINDVLFRKFILAGLLTLGLEMQLGNYISVLLENDFKVVSILDFKITGIIMYGILQVENAVLVIVLAIMLNRLLKKLSVNNLTQLNVGTALFTFGFFGLTITNSFVFLIIAMVILSIGELMYVPVKNTLLAELPDDENRSKYMALNTLNVRGASILGAIGLSIGGLLPPWGMGIIYLLMGAVSILLFYDIFKNKIDTLNEESNVSNG